MDVLNNLKSGDRVYLANKLTGSTLIGRTQQFYVLFTIQVFCSANFCFPKFNVSWKLFRVRQLDVLDWLVASWHFWSLFYFHRDIQ